MIGTVVRFELEGKRYEGIVQAPGPNPPGTHVLVGITVKPPGGRIGILEVPIETIELEKEEHHGCECG